MASEIQKTELEKICAELEVKITAKNQELADLNKSIRARVDSGDGDIKMAKLVLEKEIRDLEAKKADLSGTVTAALAEVTAEKIRVAQEAERLKTAQGHLSTDQAIIVNQIHDIQRRESALKSGKEKLESDITASASKILQAEADREHADKILAEAEKKLAEANRLLKDAQEKHRAAETATADLAQEANEKTAQADETRAEADRLMASVTVQMEEVAKLKEEYTQKLETSQTFAMENSKVSDKLSSWEAALESERWRLQEDRAKLAIAEKAFAAKIKGGN